MTILVLQLARLGDIYQTWPVLKALKRQNPNAELHLLTREKFAAAAPSAPGLVDQHWLLDTRSVLAPLIDEKPSIDASLDVLSQFCDEVRSENYDRIVNLSFSAFSSYLAKELSSPCSEIAGYSRFSDGYLSIPDDGSAYFYAQVGVGRPNRLHVTDLFAYVAGVELTESDWDCSSTEERVPFDRTDDTVVIHVGASSLGKTLSSSKWLSVVKGLLASWPGQIVLIGAKEEAAFAGNIAAVSGPRKPTNLVGQTDLDEVFEIVREARLLIGGDSGPMQMASLANTPVLNISLPVVSFWETGPRAKGSRILTATSEDAFSSEEIVAEAVGMLKGMPSMLPIVRVLGRTFPYVESRPQPLAFEWELLRALYMNEAFPPPPNETFLLGMKRLADVNELAIEQIETLRRLPSNQTANAILQRVDDIMEHIVNMVPEAGPMIRWFKTERLRIGPMSVTELIQATDAIHIRFRDVIGLYLAPDGHNVEGGSAAGESGHDNVILG
jgi:heptosyltransferase-3